ncbi:MAG TPA: O-antigen ligase family protein [Coriobacteriia bacterium]
MWPALATLLVAAAFGAAVHLGIEFAFVAGLAALVMVLAILRQPSWGLYLALFLVPLEAVGQIVPGVSVITWAKAVLLVTFLSFVLQMLLARRRLATPPFAGLLYGVFAIALASSLAFGSSDGSLWGMVAMFGQLVLVVLMFNLVRTRETYIRAVLAIVAGSVPVVAVGLLDVVSRRSFLGTVANQVYASAAAGIFRITSTFYDPNALARYLAFAAIVTICAASFPEMRRFRPLLFVLAVAQVFCLVNTFSRSGFLAVLATVPLYLLWERGSGNRVRRTVAVVCGAGVVLALYQPLFTILMQRFFGSSGEFQIDPNRMAIWRIGLDAFWRSPFFGQGPDNVVEAIGGFAAHNMYLEVLIAVGLVGSALFAAYVGHAALQAVRLRRHPALSDGARVAVLALAVVLFTGLVLHGFKSNELWISLSLLTCVAAIPTRTLEPAPGDPEGGSHPQ